MYILFYLFFDSFIYEVVSSGRKFSFALSGLLLPIFEYFFHMLDFLINHLVHLKLDFQMLDCFLIKSLHVVVDFYWNV